MKTWTASDALRPPVITKKTSIFQYTKHKLVWNWLAEHPDKEKREAFATLGLSGDRPRQWCYACEYVPSDSGKFDRPVCANCPLDLAKYSESLRYQEGCLGSLFIRWHRLLLICSKNVPPEIKQRALQARHDYAEIIANLPVKEGVLWE